MFEHLRCDKWSCYYIAFFYSTRAVKALYTTYIIHPLKQALVSTSIFLTFTHIHTSYLHTLPPELQPLVVAVHHGGTTHKSAATDAIISRKFPGTY